MSEQEAHDLIRKQVTSNDIVLFVKRNKQSPQCGFSGQVAQILGHLGVDYKDINVLDDPRVREGIKSTRTGPQSRSSTSKASSSAAAISSARCFNRASCRSC